MNSQSCDSLGIFFFYVPSDKNLCDLAMSDGRKREGYSGDSVRKNRETIKERMIVSKAKLGLY